MKLLIVTQKVDRDDPILGFFHRWLEEFAVNCEEVHVVGQLVGAYDLPENVIVHSLGKEDGVPVWQQIWRFKRLQWQLRRSYTAMLVHMTPIWAVLGCPENCLWRKKVYLWYEARGKRWPLRVAVYISAVKKIFSASVHGMPIRTKKSVIVGHGIDVQKFAPGSSKEEKQLITVSRITRSKHLDLITAAMSILDEYHLTLCGKTITEDDAQYAKELGFDSFKNVSVRSVSQAELIPLLQKAKVFLHASSTSLDKAVLEAMACGCPVVSTAAAVKPILPEMCQATDAKSMAEAVQAIVDLSEAEYVQLAEKQRSYVETHHNLQKLVARLVQEM